MMDLKSLISAKSYTSSLNTSTGIPLFVKRNQSASGLQYNQASSFPPSILLSNNRINGTIWPKIGQLKQLHVLDLSRNNITGTIPAPFRIWSNSNGGKFLSFPSSSFEGNPGLCGTQISPCDVNKKGLSSPPTAHRDRKFGRGSILGMTISIGVGIAILLAILLLRISRRDPGVPIEDVEEEINRAPRYSDAFGPPKLTYLNGTKAAIKRLSGDCGQMEREFQAEVEALSRAQHKNLVSLQGYCRYGNDRLLIYSYMENGSLDYWLHERVDGSSFLTWDTRLRIAQGAAQGLAYLHKEPNIVHRDIKTSNILLDEKFEAHLADFGLSRLLHPYDTHVTTDLVGTLGYIPPEYSQTLTKLSVLELFCWS
ncbi:UNVERIFIED_CONTAM: Phytosulfokine receptor 2 [Sesamum angustifolium]|uniref:Phytosulfokine receptor 2 n=1 Tax=Sesamum angustifolium TaxID=2727405 RepID=A0AAW2IKJ7_9LAMI